MTRIGLLVTHIRAEEKLLIQAFNERGIAIDVILDRNLNFDLVAGMDQRTPSGRRWDEYALIIERCISTSRGLYALAILNRWGIPTLNTYQTAAICSDKVQTTIALAEADIPQPATRLTFTESSTMSALEQTGYPAVMKPVVGSWGRLLSRIDSPSVAETIIEHKQALGDYQHHLYYIQEYVEKPDRDIRAFVIGDQTLCAIYRESAHWITNTARGGNASNCPVTEELDRICRSAAHAVGGGILAIDLLETPEGSLLVNEVNHTMEFRNSSEPTGVDIAAAAIDYMLQEAGVPA